jgi:hypothetical protein
MSAADDESLEPTIAAKGKAEAESLRAVALDSRPSASAPRPPIDARDTDLLFDDPLPVRRVPIVAKLLFGLVVGGCLFVLALSARTYQADRTARDAVVAPRVQAVAAVVAPTPTSPRVDPLPPPVAAPPPPAAVAPAPAADAKPTKATIRLGKKAHGLRVDGKLARGSSVDVSCGPHLVAVGKQKPRKVDAVCGRTVVVDGQKVTVVGENDKRKHG